MLKKAIGNLGEDIAVKYLKKNKYKILERNFRKRYGEIDIIAQKDGYTVFVEVKTRTNEKFGRPCDAVDSFKAKKIIKTSMLYLGEKFSDTYIRYDIIEVTLPEININHIENAFGGDWF